MTRKLQENQRKRVEGKLSKTERDWIDVHLARGGSPKTIRETYNRLTAMSPEEVKKLSRPQPWDKHTGRTWERIAGSRPLTKTQVRREYDRLRKTPGRLNETRKERLIGFRQDDIIRRVQDKAMGITPGRFGTARQRHDLALAKRFGASVDELEQLALEMDMEVPYYLEGN